MLTFSKKKNGQSLKSEDWPLFQKLKEADDALDTNHPKSFSYLMQNPQHIKWKNFMYSVELKVKRLSLIAEAQIIRLQEEQIAARLTKRAEKAAAKGKELKAGWDSKGRWQAHSLYKHRTQEVREASRAAHLAHAYLTGKSYARIEDPERTRIEPPIDAVSRNVKTFGGLELRKLDKEELYRLINDWKDGARGGAEDSNPQAPGSTPGAVAIKASAAAS